MQRRQFIAAVAGSAPALAAAGAGAASGESAARPGDDRRYMRELLARMAKPVLEPRSVGRLVTGRAL